MRFSSYKYNSFKRILYIGFLVIAASLLLSFRDSSPLLYHSPARDNHQPEVHGGHGTVDMVEEWKLVLEGMEEQRKNLTKSHGSRTYTISLSGELVDKRNFDDDANEAKAENEEMNGRRTLRELNYETLGLSSLASRTTETIEKSKENTGRTECKQVSSTLPNMAEFRTAPILNFSPTFNETVTEYYVTVDHDVIVIEIEGFAVNCQAEVRLTDRYGPSGVTNYTLGVGLNKVQLHVVDLLHSEPWILNTYTFNIYRQPPGELVVDFDDKLPHQVCYLGQDCGLPYLMNEPCDLQVHDYDNWKAYKYFSNTLPLCSTGSIAGRWILPCLECRRKETCYWSEAVWQPANCTHRPLSRPVLRKCLSGKKILFIGDSTLRGIMHYLMEQANGSLTEWDKTHDTRLYTNINGNTTTVAFAYYPQFWLPTNQRPLFEESLLRLINMHELERSAQTSLVDSLESVLVVGGVHWLSIQHLNRISHILRKNDLGNIRVIVKTLGAGFHFQVDGLHHLTLDEQQRLAFHNRALIGVAESLGFEVVDTFSMTMARYKDFLEGKCACHFHRVKEILPSFADFLRSSAEKGRAKVGDMPIQFHVEGDINAVYSEILLNRICDGG